MKYLKIWKDKEDYYFDFIDGESKKRMGSLSTKEAGTPGIAIKESYKAVEKAFESVVKVEN